MKTLKKLLLTYSWYPFLIPLIFIFNEFRLVYFTCVDTTNLQRLVFVTVIILSNGALFYVCYLLLRKRINAGILSLLPILFLNYYFDLFNYITKSPVINGLYEIIDTKIHWFSIFILLMIFIIVYLGLKKTQKTLIYFNLYLNTIFLLFLIIEIYKYAAIDKVGAKLINVEFKKEKFNTNASALPDIYYLIFDSYTSNSSLKKHWKYDNAFITEYFKAKGFWISENSFSNYNSTPYSVASSLNASYLNIENAEEYNNTRSSEILDMIRNSLLYKLLKYNNYSLKEVSMNENEGNVNLFPKVNLFYRTFFYLLQEKIFGVDASDYWNQNDEMISAINSVEKGKQPFLLHAHFVIPHDPYVFDSVGNKITDKKIYFDFSNEMLYLSQLKYTNTLMAKLVENIIAKDSGAIIIIQADHGFRYLKNIGMKDQINEGFSIFNAILLPDKNYTGFPDTMSSVNTFRYVLNNYFGTKYKILKNEKVNVSQRE